MAKQFAVDLHCARGRQSGFWNRCTAPEPWCPASDLRLDRFWKSISVDPGYDAVSVLPERKAGMPHQLGDRRSLGLGPEANDGRELEATSHKVLVCRVGAFYELCRIAKFSQQTESGRCMYRLTPQHRPKSISQRAPFANITLALHTSGLSGSGIEFTTFLFAHPSDTPRLQRPESDVPSRREAENFSPPISQFNSVFR
ncbi:hypothetical protein VTK26DRAFT_8920 [Humicola hyalothermophila]